MFSYPMPALVYLALYQDLVKIGLANQTTMYKRETREIGQLFEKTLMAKYGPATVGEHWMAFDTICDATQERQVSVFFFFSRFYSKGKTDSAVCNT